MSSTIVVVILVAAGEANSPSTTTISGSAVETLGPNASFVVREVAVPSDNDALRLEDEIHAAAAVEIVWSGPARTHVMLRLHVARLDRWVQRDVTFLPADNPRERSRTVGFALASMLSSESDFKNAFNKVPKEPPPEPKRPPPDEPTPRKPEPKPEAEPEPETRMEPEPETEPAPPPDRRDRETRSRRRAPPSPPPEPYALDLTVVGSTNLNGDSAKGLGGAARVQYFAVHTLWLTGSLGVRSGPLRNTNGGNDTVVSAMAGGAWRPFFPTPSTPIELDVAIQVGVLLHDFSYQQDTGGTQHQTRAIPAGQLMLDVGFRLDSSWEIIVGVGAEWAVGVTNIELRDLSGATNVDLGSVSRVRGLGVAGLRWHF